MPQKNKNPSKLIIASCSFFSFGLILLAVWNIFLTEKIRESELEREKLRKNIRRIEILEETNRDFMKDVERKKAIDFCFLELAGDHKKKYKNREMQDCIRLIMMAEEKYAHKGLDAPLILSWLEKESDGNPEAVSRAGAKGLTQLMDFRAEEIIPAMGYRGYHKELVFNPVINLEGGLNHLVDLMNLWESRGVKNLSLVLFYALHSYKWGSKNTEQLFNSERRAYRPAIEYVNWILNRREYWEERLWMSGNPSKSLALGFYDE